MFGMVTRLRTRHWTKILCWTIGMAAAVFLILDGKAETPDAGQHAFGGAVVGFFLGCLFVHWDLKDSEKPFE